MNFPLTHHWFNEIQSGKKSSEYRKRTAYWNKRITNLNIGDTITFTKGYSKETLTKTVTDIQYVSLQRLKNIDLAAYEFLKNSDSSFWKISFQ